MCLNLREILNNVYDHNFIFLSFLNDKSEKHLDQKTMPFWSFIDNLAKSSLTIFQIVSLAIREFG
ncbi:hypothetical protein PHJA_000951500 [Phtheirospermum japonicum]|uniref:Uncharacterized protein n=1 Tax=Phtheirospermum japonicum TaxID=374723 RepID=A0A830BT28_9LAMI|nr:hypothetical protein PHJA_000951500 [Phtheirospermum japonicum]